ncbi:MAG: hypothetical protein JSR46_05715 [Verrucomicrobia bacterium]|nr:hypothetical protein [Verrucomicrobiota bacterium]
MLFTYKGEYAGTKRHGQGILTSPRGDRYVGEFKNDCITGKGTYTWKNGKRIEKMLSLMKRSEKILIL